MAEFVRAALLAVVVAFAVAGLGIVGCSPPEPPADHGEKGQAAISGGADKPVVVADGLVRRSPQSSDLLGGWLLEDLGGRGVVDMVQTTIEFDADGRAMGSGGCNRFTGSYVFEDGLLTFGPLAGTKRMCPEAIMDQEDRFHRALGAVERVAVDGPFLMIYFEGSEQPLKFTRMTTEVID